MCLGPSCCRWNPVVIRRSNDLRPGEAVEVVFVLLTEAALSHAFRNRKMKDGDGMGWCEETTSTSP